MNDDDLPLPLRATRRATSWSTLATRTAGHEAPQDRHRWRSRCRRGDLHAGAGRRVRAGVRNVPRPGHDPGRSRHEGVGPDGGRGRPCRAALDRVRGYRCRGLSNTQPAAGGAMARGARRHLDYRRSQRRRVERAQVRQARRPLPECAAGRGTAGRLPPGRVGEGALRNHSPRHSGGGCDCPSPRGPCARVRPRCHSPEAAARGPRLLQRRVRAVDPRLARIDRLRGAGNQRRRPCAVSAQP